MKAMGLIQENKPNEAAKVLFSYSLWEDLGEIEHRLQLGWPNLLIWCRFGRTHAVYWELAGGADPDAEAADTVTGLMLASKHVHIGAVKALIAAGADVNKRRSAFRNGCAGRAAINYAAEAHAYGITVLLLSAGATLPHVSRYCGAPSFEHRIALYACKNRQVSSLLKISPDWITPAVLSSIESTAVAKELLQIGYSFDCDKSDQVPLVQSAVRKDVEMIRFLVETAGVAVNTTDAAGFTALLAAACLDQPHTVSFLLDHGADVNYRFPHKKFKRKELKCFGRDKEWCELVWDGGPIVAIAAARGASVETLRLLCDAGAKVTPVDRFGRSPLLLACMYSGKADVVAFFLERCPKFINRPSQSGWTPLHAQLGCNHAVRKGAKSKTFISKAKDGNHISFADASRLLVEAGADVNAVACNGETPLHCAVVEALRNNGHRSTPLYPQQKISRPRLFPRKRDHPCPPPQPPSYHGWSVVEMLLQAGASLTVADSEHQTPLHVLAKGGAFERALALVRGQGAKLPVAGSTLLECASHPEQCVFDLAESEASRIAVSQRLLHAGALPGAADSEGESALARFALANDHRTVQLFVRKGADVDFGTTPPLATAVYGGLVGTPVALRTLLLAAADPHRPQWKSSNILRVPTIEGRTPLEIAQAVCRRFANPVVAYLIERLVVEYAVEPVDHVGWADGC